MAKTEVAVRKNTLPANWREQAKADVAKGKQQVQHIGVGQFMSTRGGILQFQGTPVPGNKMLAVVLASCLENAFYEGEFDADNPTPPSCYAFGNVDSEMVPHDAVKKPVSDSCSDCPNNKFGSAEKGRGKACKNGVRIALMHADDLKKGIDNAPVAFLKIPPTSLPGWKAYQDQLELADKPSYFGTTEVSIVPDPKSQFKVIFTLNRGVDRKLEEQLFMKAKAAEKTLAQPYQEIDTSALKKGGKGGRGDRHETAIARKPAAQAGRSKRF